MMNVTSFGNNEKVFLEHLQALVEANSGKLPSYSSIGGYPLVYLAGGAAYCADCATELINEIEAYDIHWEGAPIHCDNCSEAIESAYGDPYADEDEDEDSN